jgi:caffeoyl-CoA O-methyltransferase
MRKFDLDAWRGVEEAVRLEDERQRGAGLPPEKRYRALHPKSAQFLYQLVLAADVKNVVEVGMSAGYSTLWLARGCAATGGKVVSLERNAEIIEVAKGYFELAGVAELITVRPGDARETLATLAGPFDLAFVDGEKDEYVAYGRMLWPKLSAGASLVADNVLSHAEPTASFMEWLFGLDGAATMVLEIGRGLAWTVKGNPARRRER